MIEHKSILENTINPINAIRWSEFNNEKKDFIIILHGLYVQKETQINELRSLAQNGFNAFAVDAPHHGSRSDGYLEIMKSSSASERHQMLLGIVQQQACEIERIVSFCRSNHNKRVAVIGISMGAFSVFGSLKGSILPDACVPILGSPDWTDPSKALDEPKSILELSGPMHSIEKIAKTSLMIVNAGLDDVVSPQASRSFVKKMQKTYEKEPQNLVYNEYPESNHSMREVDWNNAWEKILLWLKEQRF